MEKIQNTIFVIIHERVNKIPWVTGVRRIMAWFALHYQKVVLLKAAKVLSMTRKVADTVNDMYSKYNINCVYDFPGLDNKTFTVYSEKSNNIALVSYWNEVKFPEMYIDLFERLDNYTFLMIGNWISDSYRDYFIKKLKDRGVFEKVRFISGLSESEKDRIISKCKFYVRLGKGEYGPGYGSIEALELGAPLIINRELGLSDFLLDYKCALIVDDSSKTNEILSFIRENDNPDRYLLLQSEIKRFIKINSWESHVETLME
jgi:glycosyltransferase involved in cell wall biosynthesis